MPKTPKPTKAQRIKALKTKLRLTEAVIDDVVAYRDRALEACHNTERALREAEAKARAATNDLAREKADHQESRRELAGSSAEIMRLEQIIEGLDTDLLVAKDERDARIGQTLHYTAALRTITRVTARYDRRRAHPDFAVAQTERALERARTIARNALGD